MHRPQSPARSSFYGRLVRPFPLLLPESPTRPMMWNEIPTTRESRVGRTVRLVLSFLLAAAASAMILAGPVWSS